MDWADSEGARLGISVTNKNKLLAAYGDDTHPESFVYGLKKGHSVPENPISALCFSVVDAIANGYFQFSVRNKEDAKRCCLPPHATGIEIAYAVVESKIRKVSDGDTGVLKSCEGPGKLTTNTTFTKARFLIQVDAAYKGFDLVYWIRWTIAAHPNLNGPWCGPFTEMIL